jgi:hypothetical protein
MPACPRRRPSTRRSRPSSPPSEKRLSSRTLRNYEDVVFLLRSSLNSYAYDSLDKVEQERWRKAYDAGDEEAFCHLFGPDKIPEHLGEFLGYFMVRKVMAGQELLRASGTVTKKLAAWLGEQGFITDQERREAARRGADAGRDLPRADRLGQLLHVEMERTERFWPVRVSREASELAEVGWGVNIVLAQVRGRWRIVELGFVYP